MLQLGVFLHGFFPAYTSVETGMPVIKLAADGVLVVGEFQHRKWSESVRAWRNERRSYLALLTSSGKGGDVPSGAD
jgi:hypothetical protein